MEEVNDSLADQPGLLNKSPEDKGERIWSNPQLQGAETCAGWLCKIKVKDASEVRRPFHQFLICRKELPTVRVAPDGRGVQGTLRVMNSHGSSLQPTFTLVFPAASTAARP